MKASKVLLVDDEVEFARTLAERLELRDFEIRIAHDGEEALLKVAAEVPDVVILDVMMPGMGGLEVLRQIKTRNPKLPVILLTGRGSTTDGIEGMHLGAFDCLTKPINIDELVGKINEGLAS